MKILETLGTFMTDSAVVLDFLTANWVVVRDHSFIPCFYSSSLQ